jgi:hypothetical protein
LLFVVCCLLFVVCCLLFVVCCLLFVVYLFILYKLLQFTLTFHFSLAETLEPGENPNTAPTRYILVIDPTDNETAVGLLFAHDLCDPAHTSICYVGDFADDTNDLVRSEAVLKVKTAMELGHTVILVNSAPIHSCFYDVFNRHFSVLSVESSEAEQDHAKGRSDSDYPYSLYSSFSIFVNSPPISFLSSLFDV